MANGQKVVLTNLDEMESLTLSVNIKGPSVFTTAQATPPGITTGAAYADLDAIGTTFAVTVPASGVLHAARYYDLDDEGLQVDLWLFSTAPAAQTDNSAFALTDADLASVIKVISFTSFSDATNGQFSSRDSLGVPYNVSGGMIYVQAQARGALNIAASNLPKFQLVILADAV